MSSQITVSFSGDPAAMRQLFGMLATLNLESMMTSANIPVTSRDTTARAFTPPPGEDDDASDINDRDEEPAAPAPKKKPGRPKSTSGEKFKEAAKVAPVEPEEPAADEPEADEQIPVEAEHVHKLHSSNFKKPADQAEAIREVMQSIIKTSGASAVVSILAKFGVKRLAELPADKYNEYGAAVLVAEAAAQSAANDIL